MAYLFFVADKDRKFDDGDGNDVSLGEHLDYVGRYSGTPDCWDRIDTDSRAEAMAEAQKSGLHLYVVDDCSYRVVGKVNEPIEVIC